MTNSTTQQSPAAAVAFARTLVEPLAHARGAVGRSKVFKQYSAMCARFHNEVSGDHVAGHVARSWQRQFN
mgnify:CR=1